VEIKGSFVGEIRKGRDIGKTPADQKFIWQDCQNCGALRWVRFENGNPASLRCKECADLALRKSSPIPYTGNPVLGEIRRGWEIGKSPNFGYIWAACSKCDVARWVMIKRGEPVSLICDSCSRLARRKVNPNTGAPQIGETRMGREIGKTPDNAGFIYRSCPDCGKLDWVLLKKGKPANLRCEGCANLAKRKTNPIPYNGNPQIGEIRQGWEIGKSPESSYIWQACKGCGLKRWVDIVRGKPINSLCKECAGLVRRGENNVRWLGGKSFYTQEFNHQLKEQIRERDNYTCQICGKKQGKKRLSIHHINYRKTDCRPQNLVSLCSAEKGEINCHALTNFNRPSWIAFFNDLMERRFPTTESCVNSPNKEDENNVALD
jgi:hypothetical protein